MSEPTGIEADRLKGRIAYLTSGPRESVDLARELRDKLAAAERERDRYKIALERLRDCDWVISLPDRMDAVRDIAREALRGSGGEG